MEDIKRVFFHEMGHLVADEINHLHFSDKDIESITIFPCQQDQTRYCGETRLLSLTKASRNTPPTKERLAQRLLAITYGCLFQAYMQGSTLKEAFDANGHEDIDLWSSMLDTHGIKYYKTAFIELDSEFFERLKYNGALNELLAIPFMDYLIDNGDRTFTVKLADLRDSIRPLIDKHLVYYERQIADYQKVIEKATPFTPRSTR